MTVVLARRKCTAATLCDGVEWLATYIPIPLWFHDILYSAKVSREKIFVGRLRFAKYSLRNFVLTLCLYINPNLDR